MKQRCEGVILRLTPFSESSYVMVIFTREFGRIEALAKGARRPKGPMVGQIDLYNVDEFMILERARAGLDLVTEASIAEEFTGLRDQPARFAAASLLGEVVLRSCMVRDPHPKAYQYVIDGLRELAKRDDVTQAMLVPLGGLLEELGFLPQLDTCVVCDSIDPQVPGTLSGKEGGFVCRNCLDSASDAALSVQALAGLRCVLRPGSKQAMRLSLPEIEAKALLAALLEYTEFVVDATLRSKDILFQLLTKK